MNGLYLLREFYEMKEANNTDDKNTYIEGIFMQSEVVNKNKRKYVEHDTDVVTYKYIEEKVNRNCAWGELDHPDTPGVKLTNASHRIVKMWKEGTNWHAKAILVPSGNGIIAKGLLACGGTLGVSSRIMGAVSNSNGITLVKPAEIITAGDIVADPSAPNAFVDSLYENREWLFVEGKYIEKDIENAKKNLNNDISMDNKIKIFKEFLAKIK